MTLAGLALLLLALPGCRPERDADADADEPADAGASRVVVLEPDALDRAGIEVEPAAVGTLAGTLTAPGTVELDPAAEAAPGAPVAGVLSRVLVGAGDRVRAGAVLAWVRSGEVTEARATWAAADARRPAARARSARLGLLLPAGGASQAQALDAEAERAEAEGAAQVAGERLALLGVDASGTGPEAPVRSPVGGVVLESFARAGSFVSPDQPLFHVGDPDRLRLVLAVPDAAIGAVRVDGALSFRVDGVLGDDGAPLALAGRVEAVGRWVGASSRTVDVRAAIEDPEHRLRPNQFATAELQLPESGGSGVLLPDEAIGTLDGEEVAFVERVPGTFVATPVTVAQRAGGQVRLAGGVEPGQRVVVRGAFALRGQLLRGELGGDDD